MSLLILCRLGSSTYHIFKQVIILDIEILFVSKNDFSPALNVLNFGRFEHQIFKLKRITW